jgi:hypothetical protein
MTRSGGFHYGSGSFGTFKQRTPGNPTCSGRCGRVGRCSRQPELGPTPEVRRQRDSM